jgi:ribose transport system substrate-binding protein
LSQNPDALILVPMGRAALAASVDRAAAQGVPVVLCASGVDGDSYVTEIGTNLYDLGARAANWLSDQLGGNGNILVMDGIPGVDTAEIAKSGAAAVWKNKPGIKILDEQYGQWSTSEAKKIAEQWIAKYGKTIQGIWSDGGQMSQGIVEAFQEAKLPVPPLASADYSNGLLRQVKDGNIKFSAGQYPNAMVIYALIPRLKFSMASRSPASSTSGAQWRRRRTSTPRTSTPSSIRSGATMSFRRSSCPTRRWLNSST